MLKLWLCKPDGRYTIRCLASTYTLYLISILKKSAAFIFMVDNLMPC